MFNLDYISEKNSHRNIYPDEHLSEIIDNSNCSETMMISISSEKNSYKLFDEQPEHSKIKFINIDSFPDGIFINKINPEEYEIVIVELKRTPYGNLNTIPLQLFSGYQHAKLLLTAVNTTDKPFNISTRYIICGINLVNDSLEASLITELPPNPIAEEIPEDFEGYKKDYVRYKNNIVRFHKDTYNKDIRFDLVHCVESSSNKGIFKANIQL